MIYFSISHKYRWVLLLIASYYFYMSWKAEYAILIMVSTLIDYFAGLQISKISLKKNRTKYLLLSIFTNIGLLFAFKYFNFFSDSTRAILERFTLSFDIPYLNVLLPVGISFYTFQTLSYTIDLYRGRIKPEKHLGIFAVYVAFFPQLVAGPIERAKNLLPQFFEKHSFEYIRVTDGLKLMLWGYVKKLVIADRLSIIVNTIYNNPADYSGISFILATVFFAFQIYCDFSGYSDIAIGAAQVMGFKLMDNFKRPYFSKSISEFWKRWHISLSSWFKDYLYIPLGGNRVPVSRWYFNLFTVFLISGLWHGANWTFVIWGALHGIYLIFGIITTNLRIRMASITGLKKVPRIHNLIKIGITFVLVCFGWIFFRANSLTDAWYIITHMFSKFNFNIASINIGVDKYDLIIVCGAILFMEFVHLLQEHMRMRKFMSNRPIWIRWSVYLILIMSILLFGMFKQIQFIYFQF